MNKASRLLQIKELLMSQQEVFVDDLSEMYNVSSVTIRKDLNELESQGYIQRIYGGAVIKQQSFFPRSIIREEILHFSGDKQHIAEIARRMVHDGDHIFIGCGDTCAAVAQALIYHNINVVTNSILVAAIMSLNPRALVKITGGTLSGYDRHFLSGDDVAKSIDSLNFKFAFLGAAGADFSHGFTTYSDFEGDVCSIVKSKTQHTVFVLGSSKFGNVNFQQIGNLDMADMIITDNGIPEEYRSYFSARNIRVITDIAGLSDI